jgi:hypothetical protein
MEAAARGWFRVLGNFVVEGFGIFGFDYGGLGVVVVHGLLEVLDRFAQSTAHIAKLTGSENDQNDQQQDQQMRWGKKIHSFLR